MTVAYRPTDGCRAHLWQNLLLQKTSLLAFTIREHTGQTFVGCKEMETLENNASIRCTQNPLNTYKSLHVGHWCTDSSVKEKVTREKKPLFVEDVNISG